MATNLELYTAANVYINGSLLVEEASVNVTRSTNSQQVITVQKGYAGESVGAHMCEISLEFAVPAAGFDKGADPDDYMDGTLPVVEFTIFAAGRAMSFKGFVTSDGFSHAANTESKLTLSARGSFNLWS